MQVSVEDITLPIHETFQSTLQGEGYWTGTLVDFIRLAGCPIGCYFCDTGYGDGGKDLPRVSRSIKSLLNELKSPRVVVSGGEPFIHKNLPDLLQSLLDNGRQVHLETSGSHWQKIPSQVWLTLSPKEHLNPQYPVQNQWWTRANEIKLIISQGNEIEFYREHLETLIDVPIYLQPEWNIHKKSLEIIRELLKEYPFYRVSLQTHKFLGIP